MKKLWNSLRGLSGNNRGSGIVVVLVSMACVALMGASLLFMSYTAMRMRATERQASRDFYNAETAIDEIRAGVQSIASEAIAVAYKSVLETYSSSTLINQRFENAFVDALEDSNLLTHSGTQYVENTLKSYVSAPSGVVEVVCGSGTGTGSVTRLPVEDVIVLEDISVTHTAANGYTTQISTDIAIGMPDFAYIMSAASLSGLPQHALIANTALNQTQGLSTIEINGSAYAGKMDLGGNANSKLTISKGTLVCAGDTTVDGTTSTGRLETNPQVKFWTGRINVKGGSSVKLSGETRVLDDLELAGGQSKAILNGSYYGFGEGKVPANAPANAKNPAKYSSAILVNGLNSVLDLSGLDRLMLAGRSYISDSLYAGHSGSSTTGIGMLESVAVRSNQQMYLIDAADLMVDTNKNGVFEATELVDQNPFVTTATDLLEKDASGNYKYIRLGPSGAANAAAYDFKLTARQYPSSGGQQIIYCFMEFETPGAINTYFENRYATTSGQLNSYLVDDTDVAAPIVVEMSNLNAFATYTSGYSIRGNNGAYTLARPTDTQFSPDGMLATFNQLKKTLIDSNTSVSEDTTPYTYIVNTDKVNGLGEGTVKTFDLPSLSSVGVVVNNVKNDGTRLAPYVISSSSPSTLRLVIASGDVSISSSFNGLVIAGGEIKITGENVVVAADEEGVVNSFAAVYNGDASDTLGNYLSNGVSASTSPDTPGSADGWALDTLVTYKNWTKN